jgi:hypothetical protein
MANNEDSNYPDIDAAGAVVGKSAGTPGSIFGAGSAAGQGLAAAYGPDVLGGNVVTKSMPETPLTVSATTPRQSAEYKRPVAADLDPGAQGAQVPPPAGPVTAAVSKADPTAVPTGMNTEQANAYYGAQNAVRNASERQDVSDARTSSVRQAAAGQASVDLDKAKGDNRVANFLAKNGADMVLAPRNSQYAAQRQAVLAGQQHANTALDAAQTRSTVANAAAVPSQRNYVQEALAQNEAGQKAQAGNLAQQEGQQKLAAGAQGLQVGQYTLQQHERMQQAVDSLHNAKTPEQQKAATANLLVMQGKNPAEWDAKTIGGRVVVGPDGSSTVVGGYGVLVNKLTGEHQLVGPPPQSELNDKGQQLEGQTVRGKDGTPYAGKTGKIVNGQFVPDTK